MESTSNTSNDFTRKRPYRSLRRACWECKKRKVHGHGMQTNANSQANTESLVPDRAEEQSTCSKHIAERLYKIEQVFERFVCRKSSVIGTSTAVPQSPTLTSLCSSAKESKVSVQGISSDAQNARSLGDGGLGTHACTSPPPIRTPDDRVDSRGPYTRNEGTHQTLAALLPSQHDADIIFESSNGWMILDGIYRASQDIYVHRDMQSYALDMQAVAKERSIIVGRTLLHLAVCINSLPPNFDCTRLSNISDLDATMEKYVTTVCSLIISSDEQMMTLHGLETLLLLAIHHMNSASLRQAWLIVRRGLSLAQLMGFQRIISVKDLSPPIQGVSNAKRIWCSFVDLDRYLGLHLRLPFGAEDYALSEGADEYLVHRARINQITKQVADLHGDVSPQSYAAALALDEQLETSTMELQKEFWEVPNIPTTARSPECHAVLERLMVQAWHFETRIFIHLPYLLRAHQDKRYDYSKVTALQASRNVLMRWFALRNAQITQACCRFAEIAVFMAAVTLTLDIVIELGTKDKNEVQNTKGTDFAMICRLITEMEKLANTSSREKIAARTAIVLKKILSSLDPSKQSTGKVRHVIPFFGTVELEAKKVPIRPMFNVDSDVGKLMKTTATGDHLPVFAFTRNSLWPRVESVEDVDFDWDIILFDGLEDRDVEGNWVF
ncbi:hypothetical protein HRS9139_02736 [Pyrenophora teres f. teres]|nr:hypothetical protein HRS9139_02736 [Pyrenophora teres f. teres]